MKEIVAKLTQQLEEAIEIGSNAEIALPDREIRNIVVCGLGGSGIGGKIVSQLLRDELEVPFVLVNDYELPAFVNEYSLVIGSSYSGNTEETISAIEESKNRGAEIAVITSGGKLLQMAEENEWNHIVVPGGEQPRAMLAYSLIQQLYLLNGYGLTDGEHIDALPEVVDLISKEENRIHVEAKQIAGKLHGKRPLIYADSSFEGLATRFRQQLNENSKILCWHHVLPEMTHNELVGWAGGDENIAPVYLGTDFDNVRTRHRWRICKEIIEKRTPHIQEIHAKGHSKIAQLFYLIHFTDWVSCYLAEIKNIDADEVNVITYLKAEMGKV